MPPLRGWNAVGAGGVVLLELRSSTKRRPDAPGPPDSRGRLSPHDPFQGCHPEARVLCGPKDLCRCWQHRRSRRVHRSFVGQRAPSSGWHGLVRGIQFPAGTPAYFSNLTSLPSLPGLGSVFLDLPQTYVRG